MFIWTDYIYGISMLRIQNPTPFVLSWVALTLSFCHFFKTENHLQTSRPSRNHLSDSSFDLHESIKNNHSNEDFPEITKIGTQKKTDALE